MTDLELTREDLERTLLFWILEAKRRLGIRDSDLEASFEACLRAADWMERVRGCEARDNVISLRSGRSDTL